jgi:hypothetical protein
MAPIASAARKLGRNAPRENYARGRWRVVVGRDGTTRYFPRVAAHYDRARDQAPPPAGPLGRGDKAAQVIAQVYLNTSLGDCVVASRYHKYGVLTANESGAGAIGTDGEVYQTYQAACGPGDNGCEMSAVNQYEQSPGIPIAGVTHTTAGSASVDNTNQNLVMVCIDVFGTLDVGMNLPDAWYHSADGSDWGPVSGADAGIVGGHEVQAYDYDAEGVWVMTWGGTRRILWPAFTATTWIDEVYTSLAPDWYAQADLAPNGIDAATLAADLALVSGGQVPPLPGPAPTPPAPAPQPPTPTPATGFSGTLAYQNGALVSVGGHAGAGSVPWATILALVLKYGSVILPVVLADIAAGKSFAQLEADILAALFPTSARRGPCGCK